MTSSFQSTETIQDEMEKLKQAQALFANKYEEKVKGTILKFADTIGASIVYINMKRILNMLIDLKEDKATLEPILNKWMPREVDLELMCSSYEEAEADTNIKSTCELVKSMTRLAEGRVDVERKANLYRKEYANHKFELFPEGFVSSNQLKDEKVWLDELGYNLSQWINEVINTDDTSLFIRTIEEIEKMKSHYGFLETEVKQLRNTWKRLNKLKKKIVNFSWLGDDVFQEWKNKYAVQEEEVQEQLEDVAAE